MFFFEKTKLKKQTGYTKSVFKFLKKDFTSFNFEKQFKNLQKNSNLNGKTNNLTTTSSFIKDHLANFWIKINPKIKPCSLDSKT